MAIEGDRLERYRNSLVFIQQGLSSFKNLNMLRTNRPCARAPCTSVQTFSCYSLPKDSHLDSHIDRTLLWAAEHGLKAYYWEWSKRLNYAAYVAERLAKTDSSGGSSGSAAADMR